MNKQRIIVESRDFEVFLDGDSLVINEYLGDYQRWCHVQICKPRTGPACFYGVPGEMKQIAANYLGVTPSEVRHYKNTLAEMHRYYIHLYKELQSQGKIRLRNPNATPGG